MKLSDKVTKTIIWAFWGCICATIYFLSWKFLLTPIFDSFNFPNWKVEDWGLLVVGLAAYHLFIAIIIIFVPSGIKNKLFGKKKENKRFMGMKITDIEEKLKNGNEE